MIMAAAISQRTEGIRIALLGALVPLNNPVRLAEEIGMLDTLSGGRLEVLLLRGTPNEHGTYDTPRDHTRAMTQEGIDLILKTWKESKPFSWQGAHYQFSTISVWPKVSQQPHPPLFGSCNSDESVVFAATRKIGMISPADQPQPCCGPVPARKLSIGASDPLHKQFPARAPEGEGVRKRRLIGCAKQSIVSYMMHKL
jgi:alkanesulfonate monooxygenase SsuD/methylene tetrahydromethanopterin reductase-like flavin-dependent oxidoreductase (luciferase family)